MGLDDISVYISFLDSNYFWLKVHFACQEKLKFKNFALEHFMQVQKLNKAYPNQAVEKNIP